MVDAANVATLMGAYDDLSDKSAQSSKNIADLLARQAEIENGVAIAQRGIAEDAKLVAITAGAGALAAQASTEKAKEVLEADTLNPEGLKRQQMAEFVRRKREADSLHDQIIEKSKVSFFDNPLEYIVNQMDLPNLISQHNLVGTKANSALRTVNDIDTTMTTEAAANKATAVTQTTESIAAASRVAANAYTLQAEDAAYKALGANIEANKVVNIGNHQQVAALQKQYDILNNEEMRKRQQLEFEIQKKRFDLWEQERRETLEGKQFRRKIITDGMGVLGMRAPDDTTINYYEKLYTDPDGRKEIQHIIDAGIRKNVTGISQIGTDPARTLYTMAKVGDYSKGKEYEPAVIAIKDVAEQLVNDKTKNLDPRKPEVFGPALNAAMVAKQKEWNINPDNSPIYKAPTVERMAQIDVVTETPWFNKVLAPSVLSAKATGATIPAVTGAQMYDKTVAAIKAGELSLPDAAYGLATYYTMAGKVNAIKNGTVGIGPQDGYKVRLGATSFATKVDLAKPEQVMAALAAGQGLTVDDIINATGTAKHVQFWTGYKAAAPESK